MTVMPVIRSIVQHFIQLPLPLAVGLTDNLFGSLSPVDRGFAGKRLNNARFGIRRTGGRVIRITPPARHRYRQQYQGNGNVHYETA